MGNWLSDALGITSPTDRTGDHYHHDPATGTATKVKASTPSLGTGLAQKAADDLKNRGKSIDDQIADAGG